MRTLVVFESMYGNTHDIAEAVADGLRVTGEASVLPVREAGSASLVGLDLLVVGGPTHAWGMTRTRTREQAISDGRRMGMRVEGRRGDIGLREWLDALPASGLLSVAFDTRIKAPSVLSGRASRGITRELRRQEQLVLAPAISFFVTRKNTLYAGEVERARRWGRALAEEAARHSGRSVIL